MIILDLDNCIADDAWRIPRIDWAQEDKQLRYHQYHLLSAVDRCGNRHLFDGGQQVIVCTGRPEQYRRITEWWLAEQGLRPLRVLMRPDTDHRSTVLVKRDLLAHAFCAGVSPSWIKCCYDDRADIVRMYQEEFRLPAEVAFIHSVSAYHTPQGDFVP